MILQRIGNRGIKLGTLFERAARRHPDNTLTLDHRPSLAPQLEGTATIAAVASAVDDIARRLRAAGVAPGEKLVIHKSDGFDITLAACAAARVGAIPVLLSPKLDGSTVATLIGRVGNPALLTDAAKLDGELADEPIAEITSRVLLAEGVHPQAVTLSALTPRARHRRSSPAPMILRSSRTPQVPPECPNWQCTPTSPSRRDIVRRPPSPHWCAAANPLSSMSRSCIRVW